jgi:hypothetical protein
MTLLLCDLAADRVEVVVDSFRFVGGAGKIQARSDARKLLRRNGVIVAIAGDWVLAPDPLAPDKWLEQWLANTDVSAGPRAVARDLAEALQGASPLAFSKGGNFLVAGCDGARAVALDLTGGSRSPDDITLSVSVLEHMGPLAEPLIRGVYSSWADVADIVPGFVLPSITNGTERSTALVGLVEAIVVVLAMRGMAGISGPLFSERLGCRDA